jgi:Polyketide cyclase / dehydrase and lipid transport
VRLLILKAGGTMEQEPLIHDAANMTYTYRIIRGVLPVSNYRLTIAGEPIDHNTIGVVWTGDFQRKDAGE